MQKVLVTGATGQIGSALTKLIGRQAIPLSRGECDLSSPQSIREALEKHKPDAIINAAAYTAVNKARRNRSCCKNQFGGTWCYG